MALTAKAADSVPPVVINEHPVSYGVWNRFLVIELTSHSIYLVIGNRSKCSGLI
jgi:hypothetical protein